MSEKMYKNHVISTQNERLTSGFRTAERPNHDGMDFTDAQRLEVKQDVEITAFADGIVTDTIVGAGIGYSVSIAHEGRILTRYFHLKPNSVKVKVGQKVKKGDVIGIMGTSGQSTGIHLHFAVKENSTAWNNGDYVAPEPYLSGVKTAGGVPIAVTKQEFIAKLAPLAVTHAQKTRISASLCIAQAALETGWGTSETMLKSNALFGIKAGSSWKGKVCSTKTKECYDGVNFTAITDLFRAYDSWEESVADYFALLSTPKYANLIGETDYREACRKVRENGYATAPNYADVLINIIEKNNLTEWDKKANVQGFEAGNFVKIMQSATVYATGETIPASRKGVVYTVQQVKGDRVLIKELVSWVFAGDLQKV